MKKRVYRNLSTEQLIAAHREIGRAVWRADVDATAAQLIAGTAIALWGLAFALEVIIAPTHYTLVGLAVVLPMLAYAAAATYQHHRLRTRKKLLQRELLWRGEN